MILLVYVSIYFQYIFTYGNSIIIWYIVSYEYIDINILEYIDCIDMLEYVCLYYLRICDDYTVCDCCTRHKKPFTNLYKLH